MRHRVTDYHVGDDLDRRYPAPAVEEEFFVNDGFLPRTHQTLMHPPVVRPAWTPQRRGRARAVLDFVRERGEGSWCDRTLGRANFTATYGAPRCEFGYVSARPPRSAAFSRALGHGIARMHAFLGARCA